MDRTTRFLRAAADAVAELGRHECAVAGVTLAEAHELHGLMESFAAGFGAGAAGIAGLGANGRRRLLDYCAPSPRFKLVRELAERLDALGAPLGGKEAGTLYDCAHETMYLAGEEEPSRGLSKVVADVLAVRKNRRTGGEVQFLAIAAE